MKDHLDRVVHAYRRQRSHHPLGHYPLWRRRCSPEQVTRWQMKIRGFLAHKVARGSPVITYDDAVKNPGPAGQSVHNVSLRELLRDTSHRFRQVQAMTYLLRVSTCTQWCQSELDFGIEQRGFVSAAAKSCSMLDVFAHIDIPVRTQPRGFENSRLTRV